MPVEYIENCINCIKRNIDAHKLEILQILI